MHLVHKKREVALSKSEIDLYYWNRYSESLLFLSLKWLETSKKGLRFSCNPKNYSAPLYWRLDLLLHLFILCPNRGNWLCTSFQSRYFYYGKEVQCSDVWYPLSWRENFGLPSNVIYQTDGTWVILVFCDTLLLFMWVIIIYYSKSGAINLLISFGNFNNGVPQTVLGY